MSPDSTSYDNNHETETLISDNRKTTTRRKPATLNQTEADIARDWHDYFNLVALVRGFTKAELSSTGNKTMTYSKRCALLLHLFPSSSSLTPLT